MIGSILQLHKILHETVIPMLVEVPVFSCLHDDIFRVAIPTWTKTLPIALATFCWPFKNIITPNSKTASLECAI